MDYYESEKAYRDYIYDHIDNVIEMYDKLIVPLKDIDNSLELPILDLAKIIHRHDESKFSKAEFEPYREYYYPTDKEKKKVKDDTPFEIAWRHHYEHNPHHPNYWKGRDMSKVFILEMLCDWFAMSKHYGTDCREWWENDAKDERLAMTDNTIKEVNYLLNLIYTKILKAE